MKEPGRWSMVALYAIGMAWAESAVVFYLRTMTNRIEPYQATPLPIIGGLGEAEVIREVATLVMLFAVGWLAGRDWPRRLGYCVTAFGLWDIFYYVFLKVICGWPKSIMNWDVLFLVPLPWWGPVLAPVLIACLMIAWGTLVTQFDWRPSPPGVVVGAWVLNTCGVLLALYVFMADSIPVASRGTDALRNVLPTRFNWPLFGVALALMAAPVAHAARCAVFKPLRNRGCRQPAAVAEAGSPVGLSREM